MIIYSASITLRTKGFTDCKDITPNLEKCLAESRIRDGLLTVIISGSTAAVTTIEYESGAVSDLKKALDRIAPMDMEYAHDLKWRDGNGFAHVRAALMRPSLSIPVVEGKLSLGTWQQVVFLDFDNRSRTRSLVVQIMGNERSDA
jgi:secondary thiamine-phosphate synthase enzyme